MSFKDFLGSMSPVYGLASGHGMFGKLAGGRPNTPDMPMNNKEQGKNQRTRALIKEEKKKAQKVKKMRGGGMVKSGRCPRDGVAKRGRTKG